MTRAPKRTSSKTNAFRVASPSQEEGPMRIQRALARAGIASRREAERLVAEGRVTINDRVAVIGEQVDPATDRICVNGTPVAAPRTDAVWMVLHKPAGVMTTRRDPQGRRTVFDLVDDVPGLVYVGRLDLLTEGVLLLTTDGKAAHRLTHPSHEVERTYVALVRGDAPQAVRDARRGVELEDGPVFPVAASCEPLGDRRWAFEVTLVDGRTREVRRLCEALGLTVERLMRIRYGPVELGDLPVGAVRPLTAHERKAMARLVDDNG